MASVQSALLSVERSPLDGVARGVLRASPGGAPPVERPAPPDGGTVSVPLAEGTELAVRVRPAAPAWLPQWTLFDPFRRDTQQWEPILTPPGLEEAQWSLHARPLRHPAWQVVRRLLASGLAVLLALAVGWRP